MKIKLLKPIELWGKGTRYNKGIYKAVVAEKEKHAIRLSKNGLNVSKVIISKKDAPAQLLEKGQFEIIDFPEKDQLTEEYKNSKIKIPRVKKIVPDGYKLRDNFRPIIFDDNPKKDEAIKYNLGHCVMRKGNKGECGRDVKFIKEIKPSRPGLKTIRIALCEKCACFKV